MADNDNDKLDRFSADEILNELRSRQERRAGAALGMPKVEPAAETVRAAEENPLAALDAAKLVQELSIQQKVIYGVDDRQDLFQVTDPVLLNDANSVASLWRANNVIDNGNGTSRLVTQNFGTSRNLCPQERFRTQPIGAFCSGFLVGPDLIATAGHCANTNDVTTIRFVFGYRMNNAATAQTTINNSEIYRGVRIAGRVLTQNGADWAVVQVDREVANHPIVKVRRVGRIANNQAVHVIGHPTGLPIKVAGGASVRDNTPAPFFVANLDTYGGNSGSPVFNSNTHEVEGILVRGETDFTQVNNCTVSLVCPTTGCRGEDVTRVSEFVNLVPVSKRVSAFPTDAPAVFQNSASGNANYELLVREGNALRHYWFNMGNLSWNQGALFGSNVQSEAAIFQNHAPGNLNYEAVVREGASLRHYWFDLGTLTWNQGALFGSNVQSAPVMFQNRAAGNLSYELLVREGNSLRHYWFNYGAGTWNKGLLFGSNVQSAPAMFQNRAPGNFNYEVLVREGSAVRHYWFNYGAGTWNQGALIGANVQSEPIVFQNHAPGNFNYEVLLREGTALRHRWFNYGAGTWNQGALLGANIQTAPAAFQNYAPGNYNYEVVAREGNALRHFWFNYGAGAWNQGGLFGANLQAAPSMFQNHAPANYNYEVLAREGNKLRHLWFNLSNLTWNQGALFG